MPQEVQSSYKSHFGIGNMFTSRLYGVLFHMLADFLYKYLASEVIFWENLQYEGTNIY